MGLFPGVERSFSVTCKGQRFAGSFPLPRDVRNIDIVVSQNLGGVPLHSIPQDTYQFERICAELEYVMADRPQELKNQQFIDYPDPEFIIDLYNEYRKAKDSWIKELKKNQHPDPPKHATKHNQPQAETLPDANIQDTARRV